MHYPLWSPYNLPLTSPPVLAPVTPQADLLVQYFTQAEKRHVQRHSTTTIPTKASLRRLAVEEIPDVHGEHLDLPLDPDIDSPQHIGVPAFEPRSRSGPTKKNKVPQRLWPQVHSIKDSFAQSAEVLKRTRRRRNHTGHVDILLVNSSGRPQFQACMIQPPKQLAVIINQEHQSRELRWTDLCADAKKAGWKLAGSQAKETPKKGTSARVAIAGGYAAPSSYLARTLAPTSVGVFMSTISLSTSWGRQQLLHRRPVRLRPL